MQASRVQIGKLPITRIPARFKTAMAGLAALALLLAACGGGDGGGEGGAGGAGGGGSGGGAPSAAFSLTIAPANLTVGQGQEALIEVNLQRDAGFSEPVQLTLNPPVAGITADTLVLSGSQARGLLAVRVSTDLAVGSVVRLDVAGTASGTRRIASSQLSVRLPQAYAQANIAAALDAGTLDYGTALLYRAYALFGDKRLPEAYRGAGSLEEDNGLFDEIRLGFAALPSAAQDALRPFTVRPADPRSVWNASAAALTAPPHRPTILASRANQAVVRQAVSPASCPAAAAGSWISQRSASHALRVWAQCRGDAANDADNVLMIAATLALLDKIYTPMTGVMGVPLLDLEGDDNAIDIYIVDDDSYVYRQGESFKPKGLGTTYWSLPETPANLGKSAFVTFPRSLFFSGRFHNTVIHEFFHVLQKAHNADFSTVEVAGKPNVHEMHWFVEASAAWASAHFDRKLAPWDRGRGAYNDAHFRFKTVFLPSFEALNVAKDLRSSSKHDYSAYIWPYFVEQETRGTDFMKNIWIGLETVGSFAAADKVIDGVYPFAANFKRFALRNINTELMPGDPLPEKLRHVDLDKDQFKDDKVEPPYLTGTLAANQDYSQDFELKNLSARYVRLNVADASPAIRKVVVDLSGLQPASELDVQALVRTADGWVAQPIDIKPDKVTFCFDKGPTTPVVHGSFKEILLIVSNHAIAKGTDISGTLKVQPKSLPCATLWEGTIKQVMRLETAIGTSTYTSNVNVVFEFDDAADVGVGEVPFRLKNGSFTWDVLHDIFGRNPPCRTTVTGAGALPLAAYQPLVPSGTSAGMSTFSEAPPQYSGHGLSVVSVTEVSNCNDRNVDVTTVDPRFTLVWWGGTGPIAADGKSIRHTYSTPNGVSYDIRLDRKTEGD